MKTGVQECFCVCSLEAYLRAASRHCSATSSKMHIAILLSSAVLSLPYIHETGQANKTSKTIHSIVANQWLRMKIMLSAHWTFLSHKWDSISEYWSQPLVLFGKNICSYGWEQFSIHQEKATIIRMYANVKWRCRNQLYMHKFQQVHATLNHVVWMLISTI